MSITSSTIIVRSVNKGIDTWRNLDRLVYNPEDPFNSIKCNVKHTSYYLLHNKNENTVDIIYIAETDSECSELNDNDLCKQLDVSVPDIRLIMGILTQQEDPWKWIASSDIKNGERCPTDSNYMFLRPGKTKSSLGMIRGEDYFFYDHEVIVYLQVFVFKYILN